MTEIDLSRAEWRKSSYSSQDGNCVEVACNLPGLVAVRDSKTPDGAQLMISQGAWRVFRGTFAPSSPARTDSWQSVASLIDVIQA